MLKRMEKDYVFHWNMLNSAITNRWRDTQAFHEGTCFAILKYYAVLLDCTFDEARERMQKRVQKRVQKRIRGA
jgi:hypothetical protein